MEKLMLLLIVLVVIDLSVSIGILYFLMSTSRAKYSSMVKKLETLKEARAALADDHAPCRLFNADGSSFDSTVRVRAIPEMPEGVPPRYTKPKGTPFGASYMLDGKDHDGRWVYKQVS